MPNNRTQKPISYRDGGEGLLETDLSVTGDFPIQVVRSYDSQSKFDSAVGSSWSYTLMRALYEYPDGSIVVRHGCGARDRYVPSGGAYASPPDGMKASLVAVGSGYELHYLNGMTDTFDNLGRLAGVRDINGNRHEYTYDARGKLPLVGTAKSSVDPTQPIVVAYAYRLLRVDERSANGQLTGKFVTFQYNDSTGRVTSVTSHDGRSVSYTHDVVGVLTKGNLVQVVALTGQTTSYAYADPYDVHNVTSITTAAGRAPVVNTYDANDRVITQTEGSRKIQFDYQVPGSRTLVTRTIVDANGLNPYTASTTYEFDVSGRISKIVTPLGHEERYAYDSNASLTRQEIWQKDGSSLSLLQAKTWTYDSTGHKLTESVTLDDGETVTRSWTYEGDWIKSQQVASSAMPSKLFRTEYLFNFGADGRPISIQAEKRRKDDGSFVTISYLYDDRNRRTTTILPDGVRQIDEYTGDYVSHSFYQVGGSPVPEMDSRFEFDGKGQLVKHWDGRGNLTQFSYDNDGRLTSRTNALGEEQLWSYTDDRLTQSELGRTIGNGEGQVVKYIHDTRGRIEAVQRKNDAGAFVTYLTFTYDSEDRRLTATDAVGRTVSFAYDLNGRVSAVTDPLGKTTQTFYDAANNRIRVRDALQRDTDIEYDDLNRVVAVTKKGIEPNARTELAYDAAGNTLSVKDPENRVTTFEFDSLSRNTRISKPMGQESNYSYDDLDRMISATTARGQQLTFAYTAWGAIREEKQYATAGANSADRILTYDYDNVGNAISVTDTGIQATPSMTMSFDSLSRAYDQTFKYLPGGDRTVERRYDRFGKLSEINLVGAGGFSNSYQTDRFSRLTNASLSGASISMAYWANDDLQSITFPNGVTTTKSYKANGPLNQIQISNASGAIESFSYTYDDLQNLSAQTDFDGTHTYAYDGLNRLISAVHPAASGLPLSEAFSYTGAGDRKDPANPSAWTYDSNHRIAASPGISYTFDAAGNLASRSDSLSLVHDPRQRLVSVTKSGVTTTYIHDAFGRRIKKSVSGVTTWYVWDGSRLIAEFDAAGTVMKRYAYLDGVTPAQMQDASGTYYVHTDLISAPRMLTNSTGQVVWRSRLSAYASANIDQDADSNGSAVVFNLRLPGQYYDAETELHYNYYRDYDPVAGRFIQSDPIGFAGGINNYAYVGGQPLKYVDPLGLEGRCEEIVTFHDDEKKYLNSPAPTYSQEFIMFRPGDGISADPGYDFPTGPGGDTPYGGLNIGLNVEIEIWKVRDKNETVISGYLLRQKWWHQFFCREKRPCLPDKEYTSVLEEPWGPWQDHTKTEHYTELQWLHMIGTFWVPIWQTPTWPTR